VIISAVVAAAANDVIGADGALPWYLPGDLRRFKSLTSGAVVVMGRSTHESILARLGHPLTGRTSVVVSGTPRDPGRGQVRFETSMDEALAAAAQLGTAAGDREFFVIGGASVFRQALPAIERIYLTRICQDIQGDRSMPAGWLAGFELRGRQDDTDSGSGLAYSFLDYQRAAQ
jgi:dihydrofolate reductase